MTLQDEFGNIDIYLFDQLLRERLRPGMRVLDAGCGGGRNLVYLLRHGYDVWATDASAEAVAHVRSLVAALAPSLPPTRVRLEPVERSAFDDGAFDVVISSAVLHFARDDRAVRGDGGGDVARAGAGRRALLPAGVLELASTARTRWDRTAICCRMGANVIS